MLAAALRSHRKLHASGIAAYALLFVAVANISLARAAEHTLMPSPQTVHIGYFLASIKPVLSIEIHALADVKGRLIAVLLTGGEARLPGR